MSTETIRKAVRLMRENATTTEAMGDPWYTADALVVESGDYIGGEEAEHIASWHPAVALAVADWLDSAANCCADCANHPPALTVARAYLGGAA